MYVLLYQGINQGLHGEIMRLISEFCTRLGPWALTQDYHFAKAPMVAAVIISLFSVAVCSCAIFLFGLGFITWARWKLISLSSGWH